MASKLRPVAGRLAGAAVDDQVVGPLGHLGVEVVLQHPQRRLGLPAAGGQRGAARRPGRVVRRPWQCSSLSRGSDARSRRSASGARRSRRASTDRRRSPARGAGRARARRRLQRGAASRTAAVAGGGRAAGARRSSARAAVRISMASTRVSPSTARRSLRAACQPIDTWSSCIAEDGIESTRAGTASRLSSETIAGRGVLGDHVAGVDAGVVGQERRQAVAAGDVEQPVGAPLADARDVGDRDGQEVEHVGRPGRRGSCRCDSTRPSGSTTGLSIGGGELAVGDRRRRARRCRGRRRAPAARSAASRRPARGCTPGWRWLATIAEPASSARRFAALAAWPGCGRRACRSAAKTASVPSSASTLIAAAMSAVRSSSSQVVRRPAPASRACRRCR